MDKFPTDKAYDSMMARIIEDRDPKARATISYLRQQKEDAREAMDQFNDLANKIRQASGTLRKMRVFQGVDVNYLTNPQREISYETDIRGRILIQNTLPLEYSRVISAASKNGWETKMGCGRNNDDGSYKNGIMANGNGWATPEFIKEWYNKCDMELTEVTIWASQGEKRSMTITMGPGVFSYSKLHGDIRDTLRVHRGDYVHPLGVIIG